MTVVSTSGHSYTEVLGHELFPRWKRTVTNVVRLLFAVCLFACASTKAPGEEPTDASAEGTGPPSFGSFDGSDDRSPLEKVKGEIDQVCSQDGCHGNSVAGLGMHTNAELMR